MLTFRFICLLLTAVFSTFLIFLALPSLAAEDSKAIQVPGPVVAPGPAVALGPAASLVPKPAANISDFTNKTSSVDIGSAYKGIRVAALLPFVEATSTITILTQTPRSANWRFDSAYGVSAGYVSINPESIGWSALLAYLSLNDLEQSSGLLRLEGNAVYSFNRFLHLMAGANVSSFIVGPRKDSLDPGLGLQTEFTVQVTRALGIGIGYAIMRQVSVDDAFKNELRENSLEFSLHGTF